MGWGGSETADVPDLLDLKLDKPSYAAGETLRARLQPRFKGTATLAVVSDKVHDILDVTVSDSGTTVDIPVKAEWGSGAYLVATAYRPLDQAAKRLPGAGTGPRLVLGGYRQAQPLRDRRGACDHAAPRKP